MDNAMAALFFRALYAYLGKAENLRWRKFRRHWLRTHGNPSRCSVCGNKVKFGRHEGPEQATLDHIIPKNALYAMELTELLYEPENFEFMCKQCNVGKSGEMPETLPPLLKKKFEELLDQKKRIK